MTFWSNMLKCLSCKVLRSYADSRNNNSLTFWSVGLAQDKLVCLPFQLVTFVTRLAWDVHSRGSSRENQFEKE